MTTYTKRWGYMLAQTQFKGIYRKEGGGFLARARIKDATGVQREIVKSLNLQTDIEALNWLHNEKENLRRGIQPRPSRLFSDYSVSLLERKILRKEIRSRANKDKWKHTLKHLIGGVEKSRHHVRGLGDYPVTEIRTFHLEQWKDEMARLIEGGLYAPTTINGWLTILRVISKAIAREYECADFMANVDDFDTSEWTTYTEEEPNALTPEDVPSFLSTLKDKWPQHYAMALLGFCTGLRPSTLRPIRRKGPEADLLWDEKRLLVRRSEIKGEVLATTKTGIRYSIHLPQEVVDVLRWHVETQLTVAQEASDLLFPSVDGRFRDHKVLNKPFRDVCKRIGLKYRITQRGMRRTFQDLARAAEVSDVVTRSVSGHATDEMQRHYSTVNPTEQRESLTRVFSVIQGGAQGPSLRTLDSETNPTTEVVGSLVGDGSALVGENEKAS